MSSSCTTAFFVVLFLGVQLALGSSSGSTTDSENRGLASRIIGGSEAELTRFPYFTYFKGFNQDGSQSRCSGSLIARDVVLTTASCLSSGWSDLTYDVWVNSTTIDLSTHEHYRVSNKTVAHPKFNSDTYPNDVGLLFLNSPVPARVPLVTMNRNRSIPVYSEPTTELTAIGLGAVYLNDTEGRVVIRPKVLMKVSINPVSQLSCKKTYTSRKVGVWNLCAGGSGDKGVCLGDNGAPLLMMKRSAKSDVQVGIAAGYGTYECPKIVDMPDIFTRVSYYAKWIDAQICKYSKYKPSTTVCPPTRKLRAETTIAL